MMTIREEIEACQEEMKASQEKRPRRGHIQKR
jgi:hypothetical protein